MPKYEALIGVTSRKMRKHSMRVRKSQRGLNAGKTHEGVLYMGELNILGGNTHKSWNPKEK